MFICDVIYMFYTRLPIIPGFLCLVLLGAQSNQVGQRIQHRGYGAVISKELDLGAPGTSFRDLAGDGPDQRTIYAVSMEGRVLV